MEVQLYAITNRGEPKGEKRRRQVELGGRGWGSFMTGIERDTGFDQGFITVIAMSKPFWHLATRYKVGGEFRKKLE